MDFIMLRSLDERLSFFLLIPESCIVLKIPSVLLNCVKFVIHGKEEEDCVMHALDLLAHCRKLLGSSSSFPFIQNIASMKIVYHKTKIKIWSIQAQVCLWRLNSMHNIVLICRIFHCLPPL